MSSDSSKSDSSSNKRKSDNDHQNEKRFKRSEEVIELSDDSDELKIVNEIKQTKIEDKTKESIECENQITGSNVSHRNATRFYLTKVLNGVDNHQFNNQFTLTIKEILSKQFGPLKQSCQFSYTYDVDWLVEQYDEEFRNLPLTIVAQQKPSTVEELSSVCKKYSNIELCFAKLPDTYGTHHTKMMVLHYHNGLRIIIHTSNLEPKDWYQKTQGLWCSELLPRLTQNDKVEDKSKTKFQTDLIEYLEAYNCQSLKKWISIIKRHDFGSVNVFLVGSIPGRHAGNKLHKFGHMKLRKILKQYGPSSKKVNKDWPIVAQFSSIGTLGKSPDLWLCSEFLDTLKSTKQEGLMQMISTNPPLKIVFPTVENVRLSLEGYIAGASIPYQSHVASKQTYLRNFMHQWISDTNGRTRAQPHIKTYTRLDDKGEEIAYFVLTSANLSKAAWGNLEKNSSQLNIRSYELGVLFLPSFHGDFSTFKRSNRLCVEGDGKEEIISIPLPYDYPLKAYSQQDQPWIVDMSYLDEADTHGKVWDLGR